MTTSVVVKTVYVVACIVVAGPAEVMAVFVSVAPGAMFEGRFEIREVGAVESTVKPWTDEGC